MGRSTAPTPGQAADTQTSESQARRTGTTSGPIGEFDPHRIRYALEAVLHRQYGTVTTARETAGRCGRHLEEASKIRLLADDARREAVELQGFLLPRVSRPHWQSNPLNLSGRLIMVGAKILTGFVSLRGSDAASALTLATLASLAIMTVVLGTHIGTQLRRRESGDPVYLVTLATTALILTTSLLTAYTYAALGSSSAPFASTAVLVAIGSIFWSYQWHDLLADQISRAHDAHRSLARAADKHLYHRDVRRFVKAEAHLRASLIRALNEDLGQRSRVDDYAREPDLLCQLLEILIGPNPRHQVDVQDAPSPTGPVEPQRSGSGDQGRGELTESYTAPEG